MERYLMTHSLLASWLYAIRENPYETADAVDEGEKKLSSYDEFLMTLRREPTPINENIQKGIDFENLVTDIIEGRGDTKNRWYAAASEVAGSVKGGAAAIPGAQGNSRPGNDAPALWPLGRPQSRCVL